LFSRLTGLGRSDASSPPANHHTPHVPWDERGERDANPLTRGDARNSEELPSRSAKSREDVEFTDFSRKDRRSS
jgi:hypothetical protein